jgi:hypothetical protein
MAEAQRHHDYHLVDPSPWPAIGAVSAFILAVGLIAWMHNMFAAAPFVFAVGAIGTAYTMIGWWRDVIREAEYQGHHSRVVQISHRYGMILFIASEVMFSSRGSGPISTPRCSRPTRRRSCAEISSATCGRRKASRRSIRGTCRCSIR